jgi:hypothetical protein
MFDRSSARQYEPDTKVVDEPTVPIRLNRVPTQELAVHVLVDGAKHRRHPRLGKTACGIVYNAQFCPTFREELVHPLSRECRCFTPEELAEADEAERQRFRP